MNRHPLPPAQGPAQGPNQSGWSRYCTAQVEQSWFKPSSVHSRHLGDALMLTLLLEGAS